MISIAAIALAIVLTLIGGLMIAGPNRESVNSSAPVFGPEPMPFGWECLCGKRECHWCGWPLDCSCVVCDAHSWTEFHADAVTEYANEFTALFNSYEVKRAKNGAMMIRTGDTGSFKFARKG